MPVFGNPLIDDDTLLPAFPWQRLKKLMEVAFEFRDDYVEAHNLLRSRGWTFADVLGTDLGSDEKLRENSPYVVDGVDHNHWDDDWNDEGRLLPFQAGIWSGWWITLTLMVFVDESEDVYFQLHEDLFSFLGLTNIALRLHVGLGQRVGCKLIQHRVAKTVENIFCFDDRGRPRLD